MKPGASPHEQWYEADLFARKVQACRLSAAAYNPPLSQGLTHFIGPANKPPAGKADMANSGPAVAIIMGSQSDWATMRHAAETLDALGVSYDARIVSAHRTPDRLSQFAHTARDEGFKVIIAGAGGAAHLPGMAAAMTPLPVFGVPVESKALSGIDSLYSIVQMPAGVPVGTLAIGRPGAVNAALLGAAVLALTDAGLAERLDAWRKKQTDSVAERPEPNA